VWQLSGASRFALHMRTRTFDGPQNGLGQPQPAKPSIVMFVRLLVRPV